MTAAKRVGKEPTSATALAKAEPRDALARPEEIGISIEAIVARVEKIRLVRSKVMKPGVHFGKVPGTDKDTLLKPGAETLCMAFQLSPHFTPAERWDGEHLEVVMTCTLVHVPTGVELGDGIGSCSTRESKYAYRHGARVCPDCGSAALRKGDDEFYCWRKKDGCGKRFPLNDERITKQNAGRVANPDLPDQYNTVRKMACKRAHVAATLFVTGASELFTQDVEDSAAPSDDGASPYDAERSASHGDRDAKPDNAQPKPVPVATDKDVDAVLAFIADSTTTVELDAVSKANKNRKWNREQKARLNEAYKERLAIITSPENDANEDPSAFGGGQ